MPEGFQSPIIFYRGDPYDRRFDSVLKFLGQVDLPVLAFADTDPTGIAIASQLPKLVGIVLPSLDALEKQLQNPLTAGKELFVDQYPIYGQMLENQERSHPCYSVWALISKHAAGVIQERWVESAMRTVA